MPEPICAVCCACPCVLKTPQQWKLEIESNWNNNVDATFIIKQPKLPPSHSPYLAPGLSRIPFRSATTGVWLTANIIKLCGLSICGAELKAVLWVAISNYLLRASVHCAGTFPFHHYTQAAPIQSQPAAAVAKAAAATQQTVSSMHHGGIFPSCNEFLVLSGKRFMSIQTAGAARFFLLNHHSEKGAGRRSAPPWLCLSQLLGRSTFPQSH